MLKEGCFYIIVILLSISVTHLYLESHVENKEIISPVQTMKFTKGDWGEINPSVVNIYTAKWCSACKALKEYLSGKNITYVNHDIEENPVFDEHLKRNNIKTIPVVIFNQEVFLGFNSSQLDSELLTYVESNTITQLTD